MPYTITTSESDLRIESRRTVDTLEDARRYVARDVIGSIGNWPGMAEHEAAEAVALALPESGGKIELPDGTVEVARV